MSPAFASPIQRIRDACLTIANRESSPTKAYAFADLTIEVALVVRGILGGTLMNGYIDGLPHIWNRIDSGEEYDLTSDRYGGDGFTPIVSGIPIDVISPLPMPALLFAHEVYLELCDEEPPATSDTSLSLPVPKRKPGRPRKIIADLIVPVEKRKRGRPRKIVA